jgi:membrane protease YdiL (CAAX protease family)
VWALALLILLLLVCNYAFVHSAGWSRLGWQLFSFGGLFVIYKISGLAAEDIGLSRARVGSGLKYAFVAVAIISVIFLVLFLLNQNIFRDHRYDQKLLTALTTALLIVPLKTVLFEELAFRGLMPSLLKNLNSGLWFVLVTSAVLFGLWHLTSAPRGNALSVGSFSNLSVVFLVFIATTVGGGFLYYLRYKSNSLVSPVVVHWFVNGFAIVLSSLSWIIRP